MTKGQVIFLTLAPPMYMTPKHPSVNAGFTMPSFYAIFSD